MRRFETVTGTAALLPQDDIDTDQVLPSAYLRGFHADYGVGLFAEWRKQADFVLAQAAYRDTRILITGANFGCGSTREHAVWAIDHFGIRVLIAPSFPEVFRANCLKNALLPIVVGPADHAALVAAAEAAGPQPAWSVDLEHQTIRAPNDVSIGFEIAPAERRALLEGLDEIALTLLQRSALDHFEARQRLARPWLQTLMKP
jgi:3-isopropylmalate/(R)-2-methylmalate dehydratase small subunit